MKAVVILLALLAAAKLGYQEYLFRGGARDALVGAYKEHAVQACQKDPRSHTLGMGPQVWANPKAIRLVIGKARSTSTPGRSTTPCGTRATAIPTYS
jgi:hypothetical protein